MARWAGANKGRRCRGRVEGRDRWAEGGDGTATRFLAGKERQVGHARYAPDAGTGPSPLTFINARMGDPCGRP